MSEYDSVSKLSEELNYYKKYCQQLENQNAALNQQLFNNIQNDVQNTQNLLSNESHKECEQRLKFMEKQLKQKLMEEQLWLKRFEQQLCEIIELKAIVENQKQQSDLTEQEIEQYKKQIIIYKEENQNEKEKYNLLISDMQEIQKQLEISDQKVDVLTKELQLVHQDVQGSTRNQLKQFKFDIELKHENLSTQPDLQSNSFSNIMLRDI